jgi:hypothetical protein
VSRSAKLLATAKTKDVRAVRYDDVLGDVVTLIESTRRAAARSVNAIMTATYFLVGGAIVEHEQRGATRAA